MSTPYTVFTQLLVFYTGPSSAKPLKASLKYISALLVCHPSESTFRL